jgi:CO/xanthine dehydrogenase Mo-binding subunit
LAIFSSASGADAEHCAVVDARADGATLWTGSQKPHFARDGVARVLGLPQDKVHGIWVPGPGSYGRNDAGDAGIDAALLSKAIVRPVRVQRMRYEGHGWDPKDRLRSTVPARRSIRTVP